MHSCIYLQNYFPADVISCCLPPRSILPHHNLNHPMHPTEPISHPSIASSLLQSSTAGTPSTSTSSSEPLTQVASILISQVISLLESTITTDEHLSFTSVLIPGSTIGKHLRYVPSLICSLNLKPENNNDTMTESRMFC